MDYGFVLQKTIVNIQKLPESRISEVNDFVDFLLNKIDNQIITEGIQEIASTSKLYNFLNSEPELYSVNDLKVKFK